MMATGAAGHLGIPDEVGAVGALLMGQFFSAGECNLDIVKK